MKSFVFLISILVAAGIGYFTCKYFHRPCDSQPYGINLVESSGEKSLAFTSRIRSAVLLVDEAEKYLDSYKKKYFQSSISFTIDSSDVAKLINNPKCNKGLRVYFGLKDESKPKDITLMVVGVDKNNENVFVNYDGDNYVIDYTNPCPKDCPLNSSGTADRRTIKP